MKLHDFYFILNKASKILARQKYLFIKINSRMVNIMKQKEPFSMISWSIQVLYILSNLQDSLHKNTWFYTNVINNHILNHNVTPKAYAKWDVRGFWLIQKVFHQYPKSGKDFIIDIMPWSFFLPFLVGLGKQVLK